MSTFLVLLRSLLAGTTGEGDSRRAAVAATSRSRRICRSIDIAEIELYPCGARNSEGLIMEEEGCFYRDNSTRTGTHVRYGIQEGIFGDLGIGNRLPPYDDAAVHADDASLHKSALLANATAALLMSSNHERQRDEITVIMAMFGEHLIDVDIDTAN